MTHNKSLHNQFFSIDMDAKDYSVYVNKAIELIVKNYSSEITLEYLADNIHISPKYLSSLFKKEVGCGIYSVVSILRIIKARDILTSENSVKQAAFDVGFKCPKSFTKMFKRITGESPSEFKKRMLL